MIDVRAALFETKNLHSIGKKETRFPFIRQSCRSSQPQALLEASQEGVCGPNERARYRLRRTAHHPAVMTACIFLGTIPARDIYT